METPQATVDQHDQPSQETPLTEQLKDTLSVPPQQLTEMQFRQLRRAYFTVRHARVEECGHKLDPINQPGNNCEYCWFGWLNAHGELVQTADKAFQEQGKAFLIKMRGVKFTKMFLRFMATLAKFKQEADEKLLREKQTKDSGTAQETLRGEPGSDQSGNSCVCTEQSCESERSSASMEIE